MFWLEIDTNTLKLTNSRLQYNDAFSSVQIELSDGKIFAWGESPKARHVHEYDIAQNKWTSIFCKLYKKYQG